MNDPAPLALSREEKLKIFGIVALHKSVPAEMVTDKIALMLIASYSQSDAIIAVVSALQQMGKNPIDHVIPHIIVQRNAEDIIAMPPLLVSTPVAIPPAVRADKSKGEMANFVRYVFDKAEASHDDKLVADLVIKKFLKAKI